jgi:hypothetical protein
MITSPTVAGSLHDPSQRRGEGMRTAMVSLMAIRFRSSGCLFSILASVVLTVVLNLMLRGCS